MPGSRRLRRSNRKEREQRVTGMEMKEQQSLRQLMDILQMKYWTYGIQISPNTFGRLQLFSFITLVLNRYKK